MKIAVITQYFPTSTQPWAGHSAYQTLRRLALLHDVQVFYPLARYPKALTPATARITPPDLTWNPPGVRATYIPYPVLPVVSRPLNGFVMSSRLLPAVRAYAPDVLLNYVVYPDGLAAVRIGRALGKPVVLTAIGSDLNRIPDPLCGWLTRYTLRHAAVTTTVSRDLAQTAIRLGASPSTTFPIQNGCDTTVFHPGPEPQARIAARQSLNLDPTHEIILYVGRLDLRKGLRELIDAMAQLALARPSAYCYILGDGPDKPILLQAIAAHSLAARVHLIPSRPTGEVAQWLAAANLLTLPSYKEGCPNVVLEALAAGRPVVATNVGGIPELMDSSVGRLVSSHSVPALTQALAEVLDAPWNAQQISAKHSRSWTDVARDLEAVLASSLVIP